jgi:transcriptional regulator with XRE-family HTH domain
MSIPLKNLPDLADRLIYVRRLKDLTQAELAELAQTTQQAIQQAETGKARNPRYLAKLAHVLDIPHEWLAMNMVPQKSGTKSGFSEKGDDVLSSFYAMPKKDQDLMLELMRARSKKK